MADMLSIGASGLMTYQKALNTTGHNISNVNTEGYTRQRVELDARNPSGTGVGFFGQGVEIDTVRRMYDGFLTTALQDNTSRSNELDTFHQFIGQIDSLLANSQAGLSPSLQQFFSSVQGVTDDPASIPARQVMVSEGESLAGRFNYIFDQLESLNKGVNIAVTNMAGEVSSLAGSIAQMNTDIVSQTGKFGGQPPNDLLDQRDELIRKLSEIISVSTVPQDDGALNIFIGSGQALVLGSDASRLDIQANGFDGSYPDIFLTPALGGPGVNISSQLTGGSLGGALDFRQDVLNPTMNELGLLAVGLSETFNAQHQSGLDLDDSFGSDFFLPLSVNIGGHSSNTGTGVITASFTSAGDLTKSDYTLTYTGGTSYNLIRQSDNTAFVVDTAVPASMTVDGFTLNIIAGAAVGDKFLVQPTRYAAQNFDVITQDPREIAVAGAVRTLTSSLNLGDGVITEGVVIDPADPNFLQTAAIEFGTSGAGTAPYADQYRINAGAWVPYVSGADIDVNGMRTQISGAPFSGDTFTIERNSGGTSDNRNGLLLAELQTIPTLLNNSSGIATADYQSTYGQMVSRIGAKTHQIEMSNNAQNVLLEQAINARGAIAGVNLDEEATNMLRYQQAYQANAQVISTANSLFQTLINAFN
ncbi:MAG: flagellar hook-associated protein FlgK [Gammaproteobacteria bacterium]|nr:flagellar hook-associated protein FlgK [Gammaproteobacteria bacterium]